MPLDDDHQQCCLHEYLERVAARAPERLAVSDCVTDYSYGDVDRAANRLANALVSVGAAGVVAVYLPNCAGIMPACFGVLKAGCAVLMIDPATPMDRTRSLLDDASVAIVVTMTDHRESLGCSSDAARTVVCMDQDLNRYLDLAPGLEVDVDAPAALVYTSGSTGTPKGIIHTHRDWMIALGHDTHSIKSSPHDRIGLLFSSNSSTTYFVMLASMLAGSSFHVYDMQSLGVTQLVDWLERERITELSIAATSFRLAFSGRPRPDRLRHLELVRVGGEMMHRSDFELFRRAFRPGTFFRVGLTSSEDLLISQCFLSHDTVLPPGEVMPVGYPCRPVEIEIHDELGRPVPAGVAGEVVTRGAAIAEGYWNRPELSGDFSPDADRPGVQVHRTGDLGYLTEDRLLHLTGRRDHMVKVRGNRVELGEIEAQLLGIAGIRQACVVARPDRNGSMQLLAHLAVDIDHIPKIRDTHHELSRRLPAYMLPARYLFSEELPTDSTGKVDRDRLPEPGSSRPPLDERYVAPAGPIERALAEIWCEVLGVDRVGRHDDFMLLGGDSLMAAQVFFMVEDGLGTKLPPSVLLHAGTIRLLADRIATVRREQVTPLVELQAGEPGAPALVLFAPLKGDVIMFRDLVSHLPHDVRVLGFQSWTGDLRAMSKQTVGDLVGSYLELLLAEQPHGPYHLAGLSFGGVLAYEAAYRLSARGENVGFVALFDTFGPGDSVVVERPLTRPSAGLSDRIRRVRTLTDVRRAVERRASSFWRRATRSVRAFAPRRALQSDATCIESRLLGAPYHPPRLSADVHLFRANDRGTATHIDPERLGWGTIVDGALHLHDVSGAHHRSAAGENAEPVAAVLASAFVR